MNTIIVTILISATTFVIFLCFQLKYYNDTQKYRRIFETFFEKKDSYSCRNEIENGSEYPQINLVGEQESDLNSLIKEINIYLYKTKGTSDYEFVRNKVERKLNLRYDQSTVHIAFPTYLGLMGTFTGVFLGILMFVIGFDGAGNVSDESIRNLLIGVLVSMSTSLVGLYLTTKNNHYAGEARKRIEDDKNEFYDFIQTEVTKTASASLVTAISKLHDTVDKFEPAFSTIIWQFQEVFKDSTKAFGENFKENVDAVTDAVGIMGKNIDKINNNIELQEKLLATFKSGELVRGMEKYVEASNHFVGITQSLNKFEEARRMMLAAAQEAIAIQNQYNESLKIPREVAVRIAQILDRVKNFEENVNSLGDKLISREILGNNVVESIQEQIKGISKKGKIADRFLEMADGKLEDLYTKQTAVIATMNERYRQALAGHIEGFETMLAAQTEELEKRHDAFLRAVEDRFNVEDVRQEFTNLRKLEQIERKVGEIASSTLSSEDIHKEMTYIQKELQGLKSEITAMKQSTKENAKSKFAIFGGRKKK